MEANKSTSKTIADDSFTAKLDKGLKLSFRRLVAKKRMENGKFVFSKNGKIYTVSARNL